MKNRHKKVKMKNKQKRLENKRSGAIKSVGRTLFAQS